MKRAAAAGATGPEDRKRDEKRGSREIPGCPWSHGGFCAQTGGEGTGRNAYAPTEAECEEKLARKIAQMKKEITGLCVQVKVE